MSRSRAISVSTIKKSPDRRLSARPRKSTDDNHNEDSSTSSSFLGAKRGSSVSTAYQRLRHLIVQGQLAPGSWILEAELASRLGLSRTPVRSALQLLQREGLVVEQKNGTKSRMRVSPLTKEDLVELYHIVGKIEGHAATLTAELPELERRELCAQLSAINQKLSEVANSQFDEHRSVFELDTRFHALLVSASSGPRLMNLHNAVKPQIERYWRLYAHTMLHDLPLSVAEHEDIIRGIRKGDAKLAERAVEANWKNGAKRIGRIIDVFGESGSF